MSREHVSLGDPKAIFEQVAALIRAGDHVPADALLSQALQDFPNDPNFLRLQGFSFADQGQLAEAVDRLTHVTRLMPESAQAHEDLANVKLRQRDVEGAIASLRSAAKHERGSQAQQRLGELLTAVGRHSEAESVFEASLDADPNRRELSEAMELVQQGNLSEAERRYRDIIRQQPDSVDAIRLLGVLLVRRERFDDAAACFRRAVELAPDFWKAWMNLGGALSEQQKFSEAEAAYLSAAKLDRGAVQTLERLGANALKAGELDKCIDYLERSLELDSEYFPSLLSMGHALKTIGRQDEAIESYYGSIRSRPDFGEAYWSLANLKTFRFKDEDLEQMHEQLARVADSTDEEAQDAEIAFHFSLGKASEDRKDYALAFDHYFSGNSKKRFKVDYDPIAYQDNNDRIIDVFNKAFFEERQGWGYDDDSPILILGLPRSGSTLLEQILASHSGVEGTAELHYLIRAATETGLNRADGIRYPQVMHELKSHHVRGIGEEYIENTLKHRTGSPYFTDKMPNNFVAIGFLHTILPNAKVIDARRHPLDSCLGTFKQLFANGQLFSYDLYDLAHYYTQYIRMIDHWNDVLPGKVLTVNYEDVVGDLETQARRIAEHCKLDWEPNMLEFHANERAVKTASSEQVRQPIYSSSVALWRRYEDQLGELIEYLEPVLMRLPEEDRPAILR
ncbi:MAG: sulfotransferase [Pseudomonadota bacterium]